MPDNFFKKYAIEILTFIMLLVYSLMLNLQFLDGANINYTFSGHDEYLTVREVYSILNPASFKHFFMGIVAGDIYFYGRMMFYTDALFAFLPYKIWGLDGLILSIRMTHVLFLFSGIILLGRTFLRNNLNRAVFYLGIFTLYYSAYFMMIPKPEPLQLLVLSVFLFYAFKKEWTYGKHFIFLGMAYGLKFNVLMILPIFFLLPLFIRKFNLKAGIVSGLYFLGGVLIAMPTLLLGLVKSVFLKAYIASTFKNTGHYDDAGATLTDWIGSGFFTYYSGNSIVGSVILALVLGLIGMLVVNYFRTKKIQTSLIILLLGLCLFLPVVFLTKRMWPHYLWTSFVFMMLGLFTFYEEDFFAGARKSVYRIVLLGCFVIMAVFSILIIQPLTNLAAKSKEVELNSSLAHKYLKNKSQEFIAVQDISVWYPYKEFLEAGRYHPFADPYPYENVKQKFQWINFINPETMEVEKADYLITNLRNFETSVRKYGSLKDEIDGKGDSLMRLQLNKTMFLDTTFGKLRVYRIVHE